MRWIRNIWLRLHSIWQQRQLDQDLEDELASHLACKQLALENQGIQPSEASVQAH